MKLDRDVVDILCCPLCKGELDQKEEQFICKDCKSTYSKRSVRAGGQEEFVFDFRIHRPPYCLPEGLQKWALIQKTFENQGERIAILDDLDLYFNEIDSVREIYTEEFLIKGSVLDVGGHQGRLRHYLNENVSLYVSVDPYLEVFEDVESQTNLLRAYPCLSNSLNFLACYAENLPFAKKSFDWVHMRSVLDHFEDPYLSLKEAYRVLKYGGSLLIGLTVMGGDRR